MTGSGREAVRRTCFTAGQSRRAAYGLSLKAQADRLTSIGEISVGYDATREMVVVTAQKLGSRTFKVGRQRNDDTDIDDPRTTSSGASRTRYAGRRLPSSSRETISSTARRPTWLLGGRTAVSEGSPRWAISSS